MNTREYITSGVLEAYLLGVISEEEEQEVQEMAFAYPEVKASLLSLEEEIELLCLESAVPPPAQTWTKIQARIGKSEIQKHQPYADPFSDAGAKSKEPPKPEYLEVEVNDTHLRVHKYWRPAFIAVFILGKIFLACFLYYYFKSNSLEQEVERLKAETKEIRGR
ncbi:hypothetical protein [Arsenicibacter rosenii]|uniref:Anti-sigma factor n=1 Tax=Arsenicibacter rosenii TaxID=1750698 RepID=A0A1S2VEY0_9BACT|nr:hypothetical protein [Arsenicibacter rosenii]OIN56845.1 hypothetical protein BLX24_23015 [Arsenicibacter rosenii]